MTQLFNTEVQGHVEIKDAVTGEILVSQHNDVHPQNMARAIARGLAHEPAAWIYKMKFGNGGTHIDAGGHIVYNPPNTIGTAATLYNTTYEEVVDDSVTAEVPNQVTSASSPNPAITSTVTISVTLDSTQPAGQAPGDGTTTDPDAPFMFDELGLFTAPNAENSTEGSMLTHLIYSPIEKTANRQLVVTYTLTVKVS